MKNKYVKLAEFAKELSTKTSIIDGLPLISRYIKDIIDAQRCSIFIYDRQKEEIWTTLADETEKIAIEPFQGIVGLTITGAEPILENDPYSNPNFLKEVDKKTGYITLNIATAPVFNSQREIIGVVQLLNKVGGFDNKDLKFMIFFANYISGFIELATLYEATKEQED